MLENIKKLSFEEAMAELDSIILKMEDGTIKLADSVSYYERGIALKNHLEGMLKDAKLKIEKIQAGPDGGVETAPFEVE
jgi:exodeoxyribonuclease VII small subunit